MNQTLVTDAPWIYVQSSGQLLRPDGSLCATGYAGHGEGRNNPTMQNVRDVGPIPCGLYRIGIPVEHHPMLGVLAIPLIPAGSNDMFGRSHFWMHGDNHDHDASLGCIIQPNAARLEVAAAEGRWLKVISAALPEEKAA